MKIVTKEQMQHIDNTTINEFGVPSIVLMENAGIRILDKIIELYPEIKNPHKLITILIGQGNNGGDGLVIARQLYNMNIEPFIVILSKEDKFKGDALINLNAIKNMGLNRNKIVEKFNMFDQFLSFRETGNDRIFKGVFVRKTKTFDTKRSETDHTIKLKYIGDPDNLMINISKMISQFNGSFIIEKYFIGIEIKERYLGDKKW